MPMPNPSGRDTSRGRGRKAVLVLAAVLLGAGCTATTDTSAPRDLTTDEANRLAVSRLQLYRAGTVSADCDVLSERDPLRITGWVDTVDHHAYGLVTGREVGGFLAFWNQEVVNAQDAQVTVPPLPVPAEGWESLPLEVGTSTLAAAQLLLVGLASDRPENPQLLLQSGATWLRSGDVDGTAVDVMTGPLAAGETESSFRYHLDADGYPLRVEARLDGTRWSRCDLAPAEGVDLTPPVG